MEEFRIYFTEWKEDSLIESYIVIEAETICILDTSGTLIAFDADDKIVHAFNSWNRIHLIKEEIDE